MIGDKAISAFVITFNEESNIAGCLDSVRWADELVVVDSFSTDRTVEIASRYTDRIFQREFAGHVAQTRWGSELTTCPWILWLDADERLTREAQDELRRALTEHRRPGYRGYAFPRKTFFMGRWIAHSGWYPQHKLRLWDRRFGHVGGEEPHARVEVNGPVKKLKGNILHYTYPRGIVDMVATSTKYAAYAAKARHQAGTRFSLASLLLKPPATFLKKYLLQLGFLDGMPGLAISIVSAYYRFVREAIIWELQSGRRPVEAPAAPPAEARQDATHPPEQAAANASDRQS